VQGFCDFNIPFTCSPTTTLKDVVIRAVKRKQIRFLVRFRFHLFYFLSVGYGAIAINTTIEEDVLIASKIKGNKKNEAKESKKDIPPPPKLNFTEEDLNLLQV
jgi:hypothetical protein